MQCLELLLCSLQTEASPAAMFARQILAKMEEHVLEVALGTLAVAHLTIAVPTAKCQVRMFILYLSYINKEVWGVVRQKVLRFLSAFYRKYVTAKNVSS